MGIVVIGSAIIIDRIIDFLPQTETSLEEEAMMQFPLHSVLLVLVRNGNGVESVHLQPKR